MSTAKIVTALVSGFMLAATPAVAQVSSASKLSVAKSVRAGSPAAESSNLAGGSVVIAVLAAAAIIAGIVIAADGDDDPVSA